MWLEVLGNGVHSKLGQITYRPAKELFPGSHTSCPHSFSNLTTMCESAAVLMRTRQKYKMFKQLHYYYSRPTYKVQEHKRDLKPKEIKQGFQSIGFEKQHLIRSFLGRQRVERGSK
jgi:hypothetical protein